MQHPHRKITQEEWDDLFSGQPAVAMPTIWGHGGPEDIHHALDMIHTVLALAGSTELNDVVDEKEDQLNRLDNLQQQLKLDKIEPNAAQIIEKGQDKLALLHKQRTMPTRELVQPPFISAVVPLPPNVLYDSVAHHAAHSVGVLSHNHVIVSEYHIRFLQLLRSISRHEFGAAAALDSFRFLDKKSRSSDTEDIKRLESPLIRLCAENGLGQSSALPLAFARVMRDEQCKYSSIAFTFLRDQDHCKPKVRITYNRRSEVWTAHAQQYGSSGFAIPDDTLHFLGISDIGQGHFNRNAHGVEGTNPGHTNTKTIMVSPIPSSIWFAERLPLKQMHGTSLVRDVRTPINSRPLMYDQPLSYPAHFATYIQSTLLRRYGSTMDQMGDIDSLRAVHQALKNPSFPFYQQFFPKKPKQSSKKSKTSAEPATTTNNYLHNNDNWRKAPDPATKKILKLLRDVQVEELVAKEHAELIKQWGDLKEEKEALIGDVDQSQPALAQIKAALEASNKPQCSFEPHCWPFERLYYELKATLPLDEFLADLEADVTTLAKFAPTPLAMQFALSPVPYQDAGARYWASHIHTADDVYDPAKGELGDWNSSLASPLLQD